MSIVFEAKVDGKYRVQTVRTAEYHGRLEIYEEDADQPLKTWDVSLAYDARFGPDVSDVMEWQEMILAFIDGQSL